MNCIYCQRPTHGSLAKDIFTCYSCNTEYLFLAHSNHLNMYVDPRNFVQFALPPYAPRTYIIANGTIPLIFDYIVDNIRPDNIKDKIKLYLTFL